MRQTTWTDAEILAHNFNLVGRPDGDATLSTAKPPPTADIEFTQGYNITPPADLPNRRQAQPFVWCALCQEATHWKGWVGEHGEGEAMVRVLIGQDCARKKGGDVIRVAANNFNARSERKSLLLSRRAVLSIAAHVRSGLAAWGSSPGLGSVMAWRGALSVACDPLARRLTDAASLSPPVLLVEAEVRDHAAEEVRARRSRADTAPIYKLEYKRFGRVEGATLYSGPNPTARIGRLVEKFDEAIKVISAPSDGLAHRQLRDALLQLRAVADGARDLERAFANSEKALQDSAIDVVFAWFNSFPKTWDLPGRFERAGRIMVVHREARWQSPERFQIPDPAAVVRPDAMDAFEAALLGHAPSYA